MKTYRGTAIHFSLNGWEAAASTSTYHIIVDLYVHGSGLERLPRFAVVPRSSLVQVDLDVTRCRSQKFLEVLKILHDLGADDEDDLIQEAAILRQVPLAHG